MTRVTDEALPLSCFSSSSSSSLSPGNGSAVSHSVSNSRGTNKSFCTYSYRGKCSVKDDGDNDGDSDNDGDDDGDD